MRCIASLDQVVGSTDLVVNSGNGVSLRYGENSIQEFRTIVFGLNNPAELTGSATLLRHGRNIVMNPTSTLSPSTTFDLRFGLTRSEEAGGSSIGAGYDPRQQGLDPALVAQFAGHQFPRFDLEGYQAVASDAFVPGIRGTYSLQPKSNNIVGRHSLKFGLEAQRYKLNNPSRR
ncbi:MAG: hypothetical protein NZ554_07645 [Bryobacteraceae bacterium]|nr:hypothetical protein [Bryobacteraceae bacterium]